MRLDRFISECKIASRKEAASLIRNGRVTVNGKIRNKPETQTNETADAVAIDGKLITYSKYIYVMLNKPDGYISATEDSKLPVVTELLSDDLKKFDVHPCGRLDRDTVGLMILTNDGKLSHDLLSPRRHVDKKYRFRCQSPLPPCAEKQFSEGITLSDGYECKPAELIADNDRLGGTIILREGKYHQIKRMFGALGNKITYLERTAFAGIILDPSLARGEYRLLTDEEISHLKKHAVTK